jgi:hypothetical protein
MSDLPLIFDTPEERETPHPVANSAIVGAGAGAAALAVTGLWLPALGLTIVGGALGYLITGRNKATDQAEAAE